ncbi:M23 family metallopeptidase [Streptomyces sp. NBC_01465]|uniref:M23 family metallopeptidase n=1 Tax=Streptomyces sp. NBC_01465 TaxID=2903878 RepID=UPI003FCC2D0A
MSFALAAPARRTRVLAGFVVAGASASLVATAIPAAAAPAAKSKGSAPVEADLGTGYRTPGGWAAGYHTGIDFPVSSGTKIKAVNAGTVVTSGWQGSYGNAVIIKHKDGVYTLSAHLTSTSVSAGQKVKAGQKIGLSGTTGNSTGPHLHFEARSSNSYGAHVDPVAYLKRIGVNL